MTPELVSKLPQVGTTVFTVMSELAARHGAVNLGQGFPDFDPSARLQSLVTEAMRAGHNQYAPLAGVRMARHSMFVDAGRARRDLGLSASRKCGNNPDVPVSWSTLGLRTGANTPLDDPRSMTLLAPGSRT